MSLQTSYTFSGRGNWSLDGTSGSATNGGAISASVPAGSTIEKAFLYATTFTSEDQNISVALTNGSRSSTVTEFVNLGDTSFLSAYRSDVTQFVSEVISN